MAVDLVPAISDIGIGEADGLTKAVTLDAKSIQEREQRTKAIHKIEETKIQDTLDHVYERVCGMLNLLPCQLMPL